ncbi:MAG: hypothetical protein GX893_05840 [Firmicutes bacterium]|nr:hypothetical protein [Bacillota bacterium]
MKKILLECLLLIFLLSGCSTADNVNISSIQPEAETDERIAALADVDFVIVPDFSYHVLLEEKMSSENTHLIRRYVKYDGHNNKVSEVVQDIPLPRREDDVVAARNWLKKNKSAKLKVLPRTFVSECVQSKWESADYDYSIEAGRLISLEELKKFGAISRLNEVFVINTKPEEIAAFIEAVEAEYLPRTDNIITSRELEILQRSLIYKIELVLRDGSGKDSTNALVTVNMQLKYRVDELGNPLDLNFEISLKDHTLQEKQKQLNMSEIGVFLRKKQMNETAVFLGEMREILIRELDLYGVKKHNPTLTYANITLNYELIEENNYLAEKFFIQ